MVAKPYLLGCLVLCSSWEVPNDESRWTLASTGPRLAGMGAGVDAVLAIARQVVVDDEFACRPYSSVTVLLVVAEPKLALERLELVAARICTCRPRTEKR